MEFDHSLDREREDLVEEWTKLLNTCRTSIRSLADEHRGEPGCLLISQHWGSNNVGVRLHWEDGREDWLIRFCIPTRCNLSEGKVVAEVDTLKLLAEKTEIPVPKVIAYGRASENPTGLGAFIIMTWVEGTRMSDLIGKRVPVGEDMYETILDPNVDKQLLRKLYDEIAEVILQLWAVNFDRIGTVSWDMDTEEFDTLTPAFTTCINDMMVYGRVLADDLYTDSFKSALDFFSNTAGQYVTHLMRQRNAVYNSRDCREKYVCRTLFHSTVPYFTYDIDINGPFKLFCDGFHPRNIFVDPETLKITGIIDWEFTYAAPPQFLGSAPEWLLLKNPCDWADDHGLSSFLKTYLPKLDLFIESIEKLERQRNMPIGNRESLSTRMRASMDEQTFWFNIAIRNPFSLDSIYWTVLDNCAFGPSSKTERVARTASQGGLYEGLESVVELKIMQLEAYNEDLGLEPVGYEERQEDEKEEFWLESSARSGSALLPDIPELGKVVLALVAVTAAFMLHRRLALVWK
ncbi:uncharacterized protein CIMG_08761 [Coccidioides immitis RS]|uniref:Uncharacterized protein n=1 Tax=Coccidioides immitis (strain RS) TaxID=246410 RepID=A0A0E1RX35_COCIM|nr:uncharacterized protein CIMG_08761 [Coccidioides immitis RS]EAS30015.1 hypothetical protein CIMG_08761 [Coccidioides immitis RS]TPX22189.1 hypothetical protein DIZ76_014054 [Coccidioides immitis]